MSSCHDAFRDGKPLINGLSDPHAHSGQMPTWFEARSSGGDRLGRAEVWGPVTRHDGLGPSENGQRANADRDDGLAARGLRLGTVSSRHDAMGASVQDRYPPSPLTSAVRWAGCCRCRGWPQNSLIAGH